MTPNGKGIFIWRLIICAAGNMIQLANMALEAGFRWVAIKASDGLYYFNQGIGPSWTQPDLLAAAVAALRSVGISVYGWGYLYGQSTDLLKKPLGAGEANVIIENIKRFKFDAYFLDVEKEYKRSGSAAQADIFMHTVRAGCPDTSFGLCSYRFPSLHPEIPWSNFFQYCNFHAPQVYWVGAHNPGNQLGRSVRELKALRDLPIVPIGSAYTEPAYNWQPTVADLNEFDRVAHSLNLPGITWWEWGENGNGIEFHPDWWNAIKAHQWPVTLPPQDWDHAITNWARTMGYIGPEPG